MTWLNYFDPDPKLRIDPATLEYVDREGEALKRTALRRQDRKEMVEGVGAKSIPGDEESQFDE